MKEFYEIKRNEDSRIIIPMNMAHENATFNLLENEPHILFKIDSKNYNKLLWPSVINDSNNNKRIFQLYSIIISLLLLLSYYLYYYKFHYMKIQLFYLFLKICIMYTIIGYIGNGFDSLELKYFYDSICKHKNK